MEKFLLGGNEFPRSYGPFTFSGQHSNPESRIRACVLLLLRTVHTLVVTFGIILGIYLYCSEKEGFSIKYFFELTVWNFWLQFTFLCTLLAIIFHEFKFGSSNTKSSNSPPKSLLIVNSFSFACTATFSCIVIPLYWCFLYDPKEFEGKHLNFFHSCITHGYIGLVVGTELLIGRLKVAKFAFFPVGFTAGSYLLCVICYKFFSNEYVYNSFDFTKPLGKIIHFGFIPMVCFVCFSIAFVEKIISKVTIKLRRN
jgi:hypothetical protein